MALRGKIAGFEGFFAIRFIDRNYQSGLGDFPDDRDWPFEFFYDSEKLERGEDELVGIEILDVSLITEEWLAELDKLDLPRVDVQEAGLTDASVSEVLRWARKTYPSRYEQATG
jgi:hypothetical protein